MRLRKKTIDSYIKRNGDGCLFCNSHNVEGRNLDLDEGAYRQTMSCSDCGHEWIDVYQLVRVIEIED